MTMTATRRANSDGRRERTLLNGTLHKTSNSLCGIKGYASLLAFPERVDEDARHWAMKILDEVARLEEIFRSVAALTPERGDPETGVDVAPLVADLARGACENKPGVVLELGRVPSGGILLPVADARMILAEVLDNARESRGADGPGVTIAVAGSVTADGLVEITVSDDGPGLAPGLADRAGEPFVTTREGHLGVGLTRVGTLMEMYGLAWGLESSPGGGVTVRLELAEARD